MREPSRGRYDTDPTYGWGKRLGRSFFEGGCPSHIRFVVQQPTESKRIGNEIDALLTFARVDFVNVDAHKQVDVPPRSRTKVPYRNPPRELSNLIRRL